MVRGTLTLIELMRDFVLFDGGVKKLPRVHQYPCTSGLTFCSNNSRELLVMMKSSA